MLCLQIENAFETDISKHFTWATKLLLSVVVIVNTLCKFTKDFTNPELVNQIVHSLINVYKLVLVMSSQFSNGKKFVYTALFVILLKLAK